MQTHIYTHLSFICIYMCVYLHAPPPRTFPVSLEVRHHEYEDEMRLQLLDQYRILTNMDEY